MDRQLRQRFLLAGLKFIRIVGQFDSLHYRVLLKKPGNLKFNLPCFAGKSFKMKDQLSNFKRGVMFLLKKLSQTRGLTKFCTTFKFAFALF